MLRNDLKYICLDFETTGLDPENDEPIQIGIVAFDYTGKVTDTFSSYIKPQKSMSELKDMVRVVTGLSSNDLVNAPSSDDLLPQVARFFDDHTVIIGHNVQFDTRVLAQAYPEIKYFASIDTFPLAQALMPFTQSYALEVLDKSLPKDKYKLIDGISSSHHDALYDAFATYKVFSECLSRIDLILEKFSYVQQYIDRSGCTLGSILQKSGNTHLAGSIPLLSKVMNGDKKLISADTLVKENLPDKGKFFIGNTPLKEVLKKLPKENIIYAFSQRNKSVIAKNLLHELGLTHIDIGSAYRFDAKSLALFFQKSSYDQGELYFALKYFFHAQAGHSTIDLNSQYDWKIYHALKDTDTARTMKSAEIMTHEFLYEKMRDQEIMPYTTIFFFDQDRRYDSHQKWEQKPFDLYVLLQITDSMIYKDMLTSPNKVSVWHELHTKLVIFIGIWQTEVAALLKDVSNSNVEVDSLVDNTYFYKTNLILQQINETFTALEAKAPSDQYAIIHEKWNRFQHIISGSCMIVTKLQGDEVHFLVKTLHSFLDYSEFQQIFEMYQTMYLSNMKKDWPALTGEARPPLTKPSIEDRPGKERISYEGKNIYIFCNNKQMSQEVLVWFHKNKPEKHRVHGENITGGKGKNIFAIKSSEYNIILGGYDFFLQCISQKISIDKCYTLCINGPLQHLISSDLLYYGNTTST